LRIGGAGLGFGIRAVSGFRFQVSPWASYLKPNLKHETGFT
jgi:hypothetical protein